MSTLYQTSNTMIHIRDKLGHEVAISLNLPDNPINESLLQLRNFLLEPLHLLPAIQWPPIIQPQAPNHFISRLLQAFRKFHQLPAAVKFTSELFNLGRNRVPRNIAGSSGLSLRLHSDGGGLAARKGNPGRI